MSTVQKQKSFKSQLAFGEEGEHEIAKILIGRGVTILPLYQFTNESAPVFFSMLCVLSLFFILPRYGSMAVMVGCASILSAYVAVLPERFRSRSGSMTAAACLVAGMWAAAAVITTLTLMGEIRG